MKRDCLHCVSNAPLNATRLIPIAVIDLAPESASLAGSVLRRSPFYHSVSAVFAHLGNLESHLH